MPVGERLSRIETLLEVMTEAQERMHEENGERTVKMEMETREHRHRTANAMQQVTGRLASIEATQATQAATIVDILDVKAPAAAKAREELSARLDTLESIVSSVKVSWKLLVAVAVGLGGLVGLAAKLLGFIGWKS